MKLRPGPLGSPFSLILLATSLADHAALALTPDEPHTGKVEWAR